jgi:hypothetical protein
MAAQVCWKPGDKNNSEKMRVSDNKMYNKKS